MLYDRIRLLEGADVVNLTVQSGTSFPANPNQGELFYRSDLNALHYYDGSQWLSAAFQAPVNFTAGHGIDITNDVISVIDHDVAFSCPGLLPAGVVFQFSSVHEFTLPAGLTGSFAHAITTATALTTLTIYKKTPLGVPTVIGTLAFDIGETAGVFTFASLQTFAEGDLIYFTLGSSDATLANVSVTLHGTLTLTP
jgi:hypothetical protein